MKKSLIEVSKKAIRRFIFNFSEFINKEKINEKKKLIR